MSAAEEQARRPDEDGDAPTERPARPTGAGAENDMRYRDELRRGFCWRCLFYALVPLLALLYFGWTTYSDWSERQEDAALQIGALQEQSTDLSNAMEQMESELETREAALAAARVALLRESDDDAATIGAKLAALPESERAAILAAYGRTGGSSEPTVETLAAGIGALDAAGRAELFAGLTETPEFDAWFGGLSLEERRAWLASAPGARETLAREDARLGGTWEAGAVEPDEMVRLLATLEGSARAEVFGALPELPNFGDWLRAAPQTERAAFFQGLPEVERAPIRAERADNAPRSLADADRRISELQRRLGAANAALDDAETRLDAAAETIKAREEALIALRLERDVASEASQEALRAVDQEREALAAARAAQADAEAERDALAAALRQSRSGAGANAANADALAALDADLAAERDAREAAEAALAEAEAQNAALADARDQLRRRLAALAEERDAADARGEELTDALAGAEERLERAATERRRLEAALDAARARAPTAGAGGDAVEMREQVALMEAAVAEAEIAVSAAEEEAEEARRAVVVEAERAARAEERLGGLEERAAAAERRATAAEERATTAEERATQAEDRARVAEARAASAEAGLAAAPDIDELRGRVAVGLQDIDEAPPAAAGRLSLSSNVAFETGKAELSDDGRAALDRVAATLIEDLGRDPDALWLLMIEGHTDRRAISTEAFPSNWELSTARASAVARYLAKQGVPPERLVAAGRASYDPIDPARTAEAYRQNRRIEFEFRRP